MSNDIENHADQVATVKALAIWKSFYASYLDEQAFETRNKDMYWCNLAMVGEGVDREALVQIVDADKEFLSLDDMPCNVAVKVIGGDFFINWGSKGEFSRMKECGPAVIRYESNGLIFEFHEFDKPIPLPADFDDATLRKQLKKWIK